MEAIGLASGVAGLVALAITLSKAIHSYSSAIKNQSKFLAELQHEILTLGDALEEFRKFLSKDDLKQLRFDEGSVLKVAITDCKRRIEQIGDIFLETRNGFKVHRIWSKVTWPFQQKEVIQMVENLRRFTQIFHFALSVTNCEILAKTSIEVSAKLTELLDVAKKSAEITKLLPDLHKHTLETSARLQGILELLPTLARQADDIREINRTLQQTEERDQEERKKRILDWLVPASSLHKHAEVQRRHTPGTGRWFLRDERFLDWADGEGTSSDFLCVGSPGTGKTMLCAIVVDYLRELYADTDTAVVYYYCDFSEQQLQTSSHFARCILRQLVQSSPSLPTAVSEFYQRTMNDLPDALWLRRLLDVLRMVSCTFRQCFLIIDAIDETEPKHQRLSLFDIMKEMREFGNTIRIFATTRPHISDIERQFPGTYPFEISASMEDLYEFLKRRIDKHPNSQEILDASLRNQIISELCDNARGMFLLPALQIDHIMDQVTKGDVKRALRDTSRSLPEVFRSTMQRIENSTPAKKELALKVLLWISYARTPLTINELQHAIAIRPDQDDFDIDDIPSVNTLVESCCGLVELMDDDIFESEDFPVRFVHLSLYEFLQRESNNLFVDAHLDITRACLRYLGFKSLQSAAQDSRRSLMNIMSEFPFLEYAALYWGSHAQNLDIESYYDLASSFLTDNDALHLFLRARDVRNPDNRSWPKATSTLLNSGSGGIAIAAGFGLPQLTERLINQHARANLEGQNVFGNTPLHECAINGSIETAQVLIRHGASLHGLNKGGATPFYLAVSFDRLEMCEMLLAHGKDQLDMPRSDGSTALHKAADVGSDEMVDFLLRSGSKVDVTNNAERGGGLTPLHLTCRRGYLSIAKLLILAGASQTLRTRDGSTALDLAATGGFLDLVKYLVEQGADVHGAHRGGWTALHRAARAGQTEIARYLLDHGAHLLTTDVVGNIPLTLAIKNGNLNCVRLILEYDPKLTFRQLLHREKRGENSQLVAFYTAHYELHKYLRELENELRGHYSTSRPVIDPMLPMTHAIENGSVDEVARLLTENPELQTKKDALSQTALHTAFLEEQRDIAVLLLERGVGIDTRGFHGWTPLHIAAAQGSYRMLCLALQYGAKIDVLSDSQQSALHKAASSHSVPVIVELLHCGCDPYARNNKGMTALHVAAHQNFAGAVRELLKPHWHPPTRSGTNYSTPLALIQDQRKATARWWAEKSGHLELGAYLRVEEKRAKSTLTPGNPEGNNNNSTNSNNSSRTASPTLSRARSGVGPLTRSTTLSSVSASTNMTSSTTFSRSTTFERRLSRRSTSGTSFLSLPSATIGGAKRHYHHDNHNMHRSTESIFSALEDEETMQHDQGNNLYDTLDQDDIVNENDEIWSSHGSLSRGYPSPARTPTFQHRPNSSHHSNSPSTPMSRDDPARIHERRLAEMVLEIDSD